jgi:hypothetical protein
MSTVTDEGGAVVSHELVIEGLRASVEGRRSSKGST